MRKNFILVYAFAFVVFLTLDMYWLTKVSPEFYRNQIGHLLAEKANLYAAAAFYLTFIFGLTYFAVLPGLAVNSIQKALLKGWLFGICTYSTFDLTCNALMKDWPILVTIVDLIWGSSLCAITSATVIFIVRKLSKIPLKS